MNPLESTVVYQPTIGTHPTRDMGEQLLAVPCCGLGNRISLLLGAIAVAKNTSLNLTVAWRTDPVLVRTAPKPTLVDFTAA